MPFSFLGPEVRVWHGHSDGDGCQALPEAILIEPIWLVVVVDRLPLNHVRVGHDIEGARAVRRQLPHDDVFSHSAQRINFSVERGLEENLDRLFEGALPQSTRIYSVDAMPRDGSQHAAVRHDVAEGTEMTIIDVDVVRAEDNSQLTDEAEPGGLDSENGKGFPNRVGGRARSVHFVLPENLLECHAIRLDEEAADRVRFSTLSIGGASLGVVGHLRHLRGLELSTSALRDGGHSLEGQIVQ